eukprot:ANDGO_01638.mRNA.1 hypothetical protein Pmar_PMAR028345
MASNSNNWETASSTSSASSSATSKSVEALIAEARRRRQNGGNSPPAEVRTDLLQQNVIGEDGLNRGNPANRAQRMHQASEASSMKQKFRKQQAEAGTDAPSGEGDAGEAPASSNDVVFGQSGISVDVRPNLGDGGPESENAPLSPPGTKLSDDSNPVQQMNDTEKRSYVSSIMRRRSPFKQSKKQSLYEYHFDERKKKVHSRLSIELVLAIDWGQRMAELRSQGYSEEKICSVIHEDVHTIVKGLLNHLDRTEKLDTLSTDSDAFLYLYAEYDAFVSDSSSLEEKLKSYPHIVSVCQVLALLYSGTYDNDIAADLSAQALHLMLHYNVRGVMFVSDHVLWNQWKDLRSYSTKRRLSPVGKVEYLERVLQQAKYSVLREENVDISKKPLMKKIEKDLNKVKQGKFEFVTGVLLALFISFFAVFLATRCYVDSSCSVPGQSMTLLAHTYDYSPPLLGDAAIQPCQVSCTLFRPACTCERSDLSCPSSELGSTCFCSSLTCDQCNICGLIRKLFRDNIFLFFFLPAILHLVIFAMSISIVRFPEAPLQWDVELDSEFYRIREANLEHMTVVVAHQVGSHHNLERTIKALLEIVRPGQVVIVHYGKTDIPFENDGVEGIIQLTTDLTNTFYEVNPEESKENGGSVNYSWVCTESRTFAIYMAVLSKVTSKHIMVLKDDCVLPRELFIPCNWFKEDELVSAISFFSRADQLVSPFGHANKVAILQDIYAKKFGVMSVWQSASGSMFWPSQHCTIWKRDDLLKVMDRHDCSLMGDAIQQGILLHKMHQSNRIKCAANVPIPVPHPSHLVCWPWNSASAKSANKSFLSRLILAPFHCRVWGCQHRANSVFADVVRTTISQYKFLLPEISVLLWVWNRNTIVLKLFILSDILDVIMDFIRLPLLFFIAYSGRWEEFSYLHQLAFYFGIVYILNVLLLAAMELWQFRERLELQSTFGFLLVYPLFCCLTQVFRQIAAFYAILRLIPRSQNSLKIIQRLRLPVLVDSNHMCTELGVTPEPPSRAETAFYKNQLRHIEIHGMQRNVDGSWSLLKWNQAAKGWEDEKSINDDEAKRQSMRRERDYTLLLILVLVPFLAGAAYLALLDFPMLILMSLIFVGFIVISVFNSALFSIA